MADDAPPPFFCPISYELMRDPVITADGLCYDRASIAQWFAGGNRTSPSTGATLATTKLIPNIALRQAIEEWEEKYLKLLQRQSITPVESTPPHTAADTFCPATQIGAGSFKEVHRATLRVPGSTTAMVVAVLKVRTGDVAAEADTLLKLGRHPHLVRFLGKCNDGPDDLLLVTEFAPLGGLDSFMEKLEEEDDETIPFPHKCTMLQQVASGMQALAATGLIHRDLATRNILVFVFELDDVTKTVVKVSDFGLTVNGYTATHAYVQNDDAKPIRYLAPEALEKGRYSEQSDVWAFGVLAWELLTDGKKPYFLIPDDGAVIAHVLGGGRLPRPTAAQCPSDALWATVKGCWKSRKKDRPTFASLLVQLGLAGDGVQGAGVSVDGSDVVAAQEATLQHQKAALEREKAALAEEKLQMQLEQQKAALAAEQRKVQLERGRVAAQRKAAAEAEQRAAAKQKAIQPKKKSASDAKALALGAVFKIVGPEDCLNGYFIENNGDRWKTVDNKPQYKQLDLVTGGAFRDSNSNKMQVYYDALGWTLFFGYDWGGPGNYAGYEYYYDHDRTCSDTPPCTGWALHPMVVKDGGSRTGGGVPPLSIDSTVTIEYLTA